MAVKQTEAVKPRVNRRYVRRNHQGKPLVHCVMEMVINSLAHGGASTIRVITEGNYFEILDNGVGLIGGPKGNRFKILSVGEPSEDAKDTPGNFGMGIKDAFYSHMNDCKLVTPPKDEQGKVFSLDFTLSDYDEALDPDKPGLEYSISELTKKSWPFLDEFRTGTWLRFNFKTRMAYGPERLAKAIAARVMSKYRDCGTIAVNGIPLPERKIIGDYKIYDETHPILKQIVAEFVHIDLSDRVTEDDLRVGGRAVAEAPFKNVLKILDDETIKLVPAVYFMDEVSGSILIPYFEEYANPDRITLASQVTIERTGETKRFSQDPRTIQFIQWLRKKAPEIQEALRIKIANAPNQVSDEMEVALLRDMINDVEDVNNTVKVKKGKKPPPPSGGPTERKGVTISTDSDEYEIGEHISATIRIRKDLQDTHSFKDIRFHTNQAHAKNITQTESGLDMVANDLGRGTVRADLPGTPHYDSAFYSVVMERQFKLNVSTKTISAGESLTLTCLNVDKAKLPITWTPVPGLSPNGKEAVYSSHQAGEVVIQATDSSVPQKRVECHIIVTESEDEDGIDPNLMVFDGIYFRYSFSDIDRSMAGENVHSDRPVQLNRTGSGTEKSPYGLVFHQQAFGYQEAREKGQLQYFLLQAVCTALPQFLHFESFRKDKDVATLRSEEWPALLKQFSREGYKLYAKIVEGKKSNRKK